MFLGSIDLERIKTFDVYFYLPITIFWHLKLMVTMAIVYLFIFVNLFILKFDFINDR